MLLYRLNRDHLLYRVSKVVLVFFGSLLLHILLVLCFLLLSYVIPSSVIQVSIRSHKKDSRQLSVVWSQDAKSSVPQHTTATVSPTKTSVSTVINTQKKSVAVQKKQAEKKPNVSENKSNKNKSLSTGTIKKQVAMPIPSSVPIPKNFDSDILQRVIQQEWKPPIGVPKEANCAIAITIDHAGNITDMVMKRSSGILIFDVSARTVLMSLSIPRIAWNKTVSITFMQ